MLDALSNPYFKLMSEYPVILGLNTVILAKELIEEIPPHVSKTARAYLSYAGLFGVPDAFLQCKKLRGDLTLLWKKQDYINLTITAIKTAVKVTDILLTISGALYIHASFVKPELKDKYYYYAVPIAATSWIATETLLAIDLLRNYYLLRRPADEDKARLQLGAKMVEELTVANAKKLLQKQQLLTVGNIALIFFDKFCYGITKVYPESLKSAAANWSSSALHFALDLYENAKTTK